MLNLGLDGGALRGTLSDFILQPLPNSPAPIPEQSPTSASIEGSIDRGALTARWRTNVGTSGTVALLRSEPSSFRPADHVFSWAEFMKWALDEAIRNPALIFRGQCSASHTLVTSFHRTGRRNLLRYSQEDVFHLRRAIEPLVGKSYDTGNPADFGALLNLGQHHGFPTPLLDFTESPFVAAYFCFSQMRNQESEHEAAVRVFIFDLATWRYGAFQTIADISPTFAPLRLGGRDNPRVLPQQSVHMFSNMVDVESFIELVENLDGRRHLWRIDIPTTERATAMRHLQVMGVTAASMFPGVEGACRALAERRF